MSSKGKGGRPSLVDVSSLLAACVIVQVGVILTGVLNGQNNLVSDRKAAMVAMFLHDLGIEISSLSDGELNWPGAWN